MSGTNLVPTPNPVLKEIIERVFAPDDDFSDIFNTKRNYNSDSRSLFLQDKFALIDPINRKHPKVFDLMKLQKSMDWDENEFPYEESKVDFLRAPKSIVSRFIETLAWQWVGDSIAAHSIAPLAHPFVSDDDYWMALLEVNRNECLHALTYGEIEKFAFPGDASLRLREVINNQSAMRRMNVVAMALKKVREIGIRLNQGVITCESDEAIDGAMLFSCAMFGLERVEFMSSFEVSFAVAEQGWFIPPVFGVQKISLDEWNIHIPLNRYVLMNERTVDRSFKSLQRIRPVVEALWADIAKAELSWNATQRDLKYDVPGLSERRLDDLVYFGINDLYNTVGWDNPHRIVKDNPSPIMDKWLQANKSQGSPQETRQGMYLLGGFTDGVPGRTFDTTDLMP